MSAAQDYKKLDPNGNRFDFGGINTVSPPDAMPPKKYPFAQNIRRYLHNQVISRATQTAALFTALGVAIHSLRRMNDTTASGPGSGFVIISGAADKVYTTATQVASGLSGNRLSMVPFRPNASPQPWMYISDSSLSATLTASGFACAGMIKVRSDGLAYKTGIKEPQQPPTVVAQNAIVNGSVTVPSTTKPWNVGGGQNAGYPYTATGGTASVVIVCAAGATIQLTATGTIVTSYSGAAGAGDLPPSNGQGTNYPGGQGNIGGSFCNVLMGAFTDSSGNVVTPTTGSGPVTVGAGPTTLLVPTGATQLQLGIDDVAYGSGSGSFNVAFTVTTQAVSANVSLLGNVTTYFWGDSPHTGPVAAYIWNNPSDSGSHPRTISTATGSVTNNSLIFDSPTLGSGTVPMQWTTLDSTGTVVGSQPVFTAPLEPEGFQDFNMVVTGSLFIPTAGTYTFTVTSKDNVMWGIGGGATWSGKGTLRGALGQTMTVVNKSALLPSPPINGEGGPTSATVAVTFPAAGNYTIELDYDYWFHSGRTLAVTCNGNPIAPLPNTVLQNTQYHYRWRSTKTGAKSNPSPISPQNQNPVQVSTVTPDFSTDPQVDVTDYFRLDTGLSNATYVGTGPNTNPATPFVDQSIDTNIAANEILEFDLFEPFPSIDLPHKGVGNAVGNTFTWVSGDKFNPRWLGGSIIKIGGVAYTLFNRPTSNVSLTVFDVANGNNLAYEIDAATLAAQPTASTWGPTAQGGFMFGLDPNNPGDVVWTNGQDPDSSADTNRWNLTSPSEPMMNGCIANGISVAFSTERSWLFFPTFTSAAATVTGTQGSPWNPVLSGMTRGLYIRTCLAVSGGGLIFFRTKDGIAVSEDGGAEQSITDADLFNLFTHEGVVAVPVTLAGFTINPPDDSRPERQSFSVGNGYLYYDYVDTSNIPRTLVYDVAAKGWVFDTYADPVTVHSLEEGQVNQTLVGTINGSVKALSGTGTEVAVCAILTPAENAGDARADKNLGDIFIKATVAAAGTVQVAPFSKRYANAVPGVTGAPLTGTGVSANYLLDFGTDPVTVSDIELALSWPAGKGTAVELWQPNFTAIPDTVQNRTTDWDNGGTQGAKFVQGVRLERNTFGANKTFRIQSSDDLSFHTPNESPCNFQGQSIQSFSVSPFIAHSMRIVTTDGVPWQEFGTEFIFKPYPEECLVWTTELVSYAKGWQTIGEMQIPYIATSPVTVTLFFDQWPTIVLTDILPVTASQLYPTKQRVVIPPNKSRLLGFTLSSAALWRPFKSMLEVSIGEWGRNTPYQIVQPFGGAAADGAEV